jgi:hypothetical protein
MDQTSTKRNMRERERERESSDKQRRLAIDEQTSLKETKEVICAFFFFFFTIIQGFDGIVELRN